MSWSNYFGGASVAPSNVQYLALALTANVTLAWPLESAEGATYLAQQIDVTPSGPGFSITLPPANRGTTGIASVFTNKGADSFTIKDNGGTQVAVIAAGVTWVIGLADNSTAAGTWDSFQLGATTSSAQAATLAGAGLEASGVQLRSKLPTNVYTTNQTLSTAHRATANVWNGGAAGTFTLDPVATTVIGWWAIIAGSTTQDLAINTSGGDTIDGDASITLPASGTTQAYSRLVVASAAGVYRTFLGPPIPTSVSAGGTGATDAANALTNLGGTALGISIFTAPSVSALFTALGLSRLPVEVTVSTNQVLAADGGGNCYVATANLTLTIPKANTVATNFCFGVFGQNGVVTVTPDAADKINNGTAGATYIVPKGTSLLMVCDGASNWWPLFVQNPAGYWVIAGGTADAITATYAPAIIALIDGVQLSFRAATANLTTTPTFSPNGLTARTITKLGGAPLVAGDIEGGNHECTVRYNLAATRWELINPAATITPPWTGAGGTADAITVSYIVGIPALYDGLLLAFRAAAANATATPTFAPNGLVAHGIVKGAGSVLVAGDIAGANHECLVRYNAGTGQWFLLNPAVVFLSVQVAVTDPNGEALFTGDGQAYFSIGPELTGRTLLDCGASVGTVSSSGEVNVQIRRVRAGVSADMLSSEIRIDANEVDSSTAAGPPVVNGANAGVQTADQIFFDIDVAGTGAKGLNVRVRFT